MKKIALCLSMMLMLSAVCADAALVENMNSNKALTKVSRGLTNIATSPGELLAQAPKAMEQSPDYITGFLMAAGRGVGYALLRLGAGIYDVATFPFPGPTHYEPVMQPETISDKVLNFSTK